MMVQPIFSELCVTLERRSRGTIRLPKPCKSADLLNETAHADRFVVTIAM